MRKMKKLHRPVDYGEAEGYEGVDTARYEAVQEELIQHLPFGGQYRYDELVMFVVTELVYENRTRSVRPYRSCLIAH